MIRSFIARAGDFRRVAMVHKRHRPRLRCFATASDFVSAAATTTTTIEKPVPPARPFESSCCGNGCHPCVWEVYEQEVTQYNVSFLVCLFVCVAVDDRKIRFVRLFRKNVCSFPQHPLSSSFAFLCLGEAKGLPGCSSGRTRQPALSRRDARRRRVDGGVSRTRSAPQERQRRLLIWMMCDTVVGCVHGASKSKKTRLWLSKKEKSEEQQHSKHHSLETTTKRVTNM